MIEPENGDAKNIGLIGVNSWYDCDIFRSPRFRNWADNPKCEIKKVG